MASQRKIAVLPKCAGMFFMSVIMGGSERKKKEEKQMQQLAYIFFQGKVESGRHGAANKVEKKP